MTEQAQITVLMATYQGETYVAQQLNSMPNLLRKVTPSLTGV